MTYKYFALSLMMIAIVGLAAWTTFLSYASDKKPSVIKVTVPDAYMEEVTALILDKQGKPSMKILAEKMTHFSENDATDLISPHLTLYRKSPQPWFVTAKFGQATEGIENLHFKQDVVIHHVADESTPATLIKTQTLMVHPNDQIADTSDHITMIQPNLVVNAMGMHADLNTGDIKLLSDARGEYVPTS